jgi:hypothetical protein
MRGLDVDLGRRCLFSLLAAEGKQEGGAEEN